MQVPKNFRLQIDLDPYRADGVLAVGGLLSFGHKTFGAISRFDEQLPDEWIPEAKREVREALLRRMWRHLGAM